jgi:phosphohistidine phosphatase
MTTLLIVRHAVAEQRDPERWPDDADRPLTTEGEERFRRAARGLRRIAPEPDLVLSSPYVRAWRTAELLHEETGCPPPERCESLQAERTPAESAEAIRAHTTTHETVAVVGHEPHLSRLVSLLLTGDPDGLPLDLKKGGVACLDLGDESPVLRWVATPKILRTLAPPPAA